MTRQTQRYSDGENALCSPTIALRYPHNRSPSAGVSRQPLGARPLSPHVSSTAQALTPCNDNDTVGFCSSIERAIASSGVIATSIGRGQSLIRENAKVNLTCTDASLALAPAVAFCGTSYPPIGDLLRFATVCTTDNVMTHQILEVTRRSRVYVEPIAD
jgi:hypothetical protein